MLELVEMFPCLNNLHITLIDHLNHLLLPLISHHLLECLTTDITSRGTSLDWVLAQRNRKKKQKPVCQMYVIKKWYFTGILLLSAKWIGKWNKWDLKLEMKRDCTTNFQRQKNTEGKIIYECHIVLQSKA